ncbi:MAG: FAD-binding oxidoreductase [Candidatus Dormibacteraceae bacterium]
MVQVSATLVRELRGIVGERQVVTSSDDLRIFERDGSIAAAAPGVVVLPGDASQVQRVVRLAAHFSVPLVSRGAGTGLSGGAVTLAGGIAMQMSRMRRLEIDPQTRTALVEPGVVNWDLQQAAARHGLFYAPDPSSQKGCTLGGNAAENSGGPHCLCYGVTTNHILGMEVCFPDGERAWVGGEGPDQPGLDLLGVLVGSEGTLCAITKILVKLLPLPERVTTLMAAFPTMETAGEAVSAVIAGGAIPAAMEIMDQACVQAVEQTYRAGYPIQAGAVLLIDVEGLQEGVAELAPAVATILRQEEATELRVAEDAAERELLWSGRKGAMGALGRIQPNYYLHDGVVPRTRLPQVLHEVRAIAARERLPLANMFHAGDGNLHPCILFDVRERGVMERVEGAGADMLRAVVEAGGTLSGEHGIGNEKNAYMPWIFSPDDLDQMRRVKRTFDPRGLTNPGKIFPPEDGEEAADAGPRTGFCAEARWW